MINILTVTTTIKDASGAPLNAVLKVRASQSFTYIDGVDTLKVGTDYTTVSIVNGKLNSTLSLAPTSGASHDKSGLFYDARIYKNNQLISEEYWLLNKSLEPSIEYASIPVANPANKQPYVYPPFGVSNGNGSLDPGIYATQQWVLDQGYVSDLSAYATIAYVDSKHNANLTLIQQNESDIADNLFLINENKSDITDNATNIEINRLEILGHHLLSNLNGSTGLMFGGELSVSAATPANTKIDISEGYGLIVDSTTDPENPIEYQVAWPNFTGLTLTHLTSAVSTYIGIDKTGLVVQQPTDFTSSQRKEIIRLGRIGHFNKATINADLALGILRYNKDMNGEDLALSLGTINVKGNVFSAAATNLTLSKTAGESYRLGINSQADNTSPNQTTDPAISPVPFSYLYSDGVGGALFQTGQTNINPTQYDLGTGALGNVSNNRYTVQRIYYYPVSNVTAIVYGNKLYDTFAAAKRGIIEDAGFGFEVLEGAVLRAALVTSGNTTNLTASDVIFISAGKLGEFVSSGGGGSTDLQTAYNNSLNPEIITNNGALTLQNGSVDDEDYVLEIADYSGTVNAGFRGDGTLIVQPGVISGVSQEAVNGSQLYSGFVPYTGATTNVNLNAKSLTNVSSLSVNGSGNFGGAITANVPTTNTVMFLQNNASIGETSIDLGTSTSGATLSRISSNRTNRVVTGDSDLVFYNITNSILTEGMRLRDDGSLNVSDSGTFGGNLTVSGSVTIGEYIYTSKNTTSYLQLGEFQTDLKFNNTGGLFLSNNNNGISVSNNIVYVTNTEAVLRYDTTAEISCNTAGINFEMGTEKRFNINNLPTSTSGLITGDVYTQTATQLGGIGTQKVMCIV